MCNEITMSRDLYISKPSAKGRKERFNMYGINECEGGCRQLGFGTLVRKQKRVINVRSVKPQTGEKRVFRVSAAMPGELLSIFSN